MKHSFLQIISLLFIFLHFESLQAQTVQQKEIDFSQGPVISSRFGGYSITLYTFSDDGKELYALRDRDLDKYYSRTDADGYTYYDMNDAGPDAVAIYDAQTGKLIQDFSKHFLKVWAIGRRPMVAFDKKCYLSSDFDCNEAEFEKHRVVFYDRLPQGWVNVAQKIKLNYAPGACMRRHLTTDSTLSISLINVIDEKTEIPVATIPNIRLFNTPEETRNFNIRFASAEYLAADRKLSKKELHDLVGPEIKNTRVTYNAETQTGYMVLYLQSQNERTAGRTVVKILRFSFKDGSAYDVYTSPIYDNAHYDFSYRGKLRLATKDILTDDYFLHYYRSYKEYNHLPDSIELIKFNNDTDSSSVSVFNLMPPAELVNIVSTGQLGNKDIYLEGLSGDTAVYSYYENLNNFEQSVYFVNYKQQKILSNWLIKSYKGQYSMGSPDIYFNATLKNMAVIQTLKINDRFWSGVKIMDVAAGKIADCDLLQYQLAYVKQAKARSEAEQKELDEIREKREKKEAAYQKLLQENEKLGRLLNSNKGTNSGSCSMCNGSGKIEKFGTHLARVAHVDSQGRTIYHNVETTTGSYYETCPKCHGSGTQ